MPRLTAEQWEQARADYEVRGMTLSEIGRKYSTSWTAVAKQAKKVGWEQGKSLNEVRKKVRAVKDYAEVEQKKLEHSQLYQQEMDSLFDELCQQDGILASLSNAIAKKAQGMLTQVEGIDDLEKLSRVKKNLTPPAAAQTQVTVQQAAMSRADATADMTPEEVCDALIAQHQADKKNGRKESPYFMRPKFDTKKVADR